MRQPYSPLSPVGRIKRAERKLDAAQKIYQETITVGKPNLQKTEDGVKILAQCTSEELQAWRHKSNVRKIREKLRVDGWFSSKVATHWAKKDRVDGGKMERLAKEFFLDAVNTSAKAAELATKYEVECLEEAAKKTDTENEEDETETKENPLREALVVLTTVIEEGEDVSEYDLPDDTSFAASETDTLVG